MNNYNLHIVLNNFKNDSRVLKETKTIAESGIFEKVLISALWEKGLHEREILDEKREVWRVPLKTRSLPKDMFSLFVKYTEWAIKILVAYRKLRIKTVHCHDLSALPIGVSFKLIKKAKLVYDAHEYETETSQNSSNKYRQFFSIILERFLIKFADSVITVSDSIATAYSNNYHIQKPYVIFNCPEYNKLSYNRILRDELNIPDDKVIFLYLGGLGAGRGIEIILNAFERMSDTDKVVVFLGYGPLAQRIMNSSCVHPNIYYHKSVSPDLVYKYSSSADIGLLFYENICLNHYYCMPNKLFEYVIAGLPIVSSNLFELTKFIQTYQIGIVASDNTEDGLINAISEISVEKIQQWKRNIPFVAVNFNWERQKSVLLNIYKETNYKDS